MAQWMQSGKLPSQVSAEARAWMTAQVEDYRAFKLNAAGLGRAMYFLGAVVFLLVVFYEQYNKRKDRLSSLPPGPFPWPYLGSLPHLLLTAGVRSSSRLREKILDLAKQHRPLMFLQIWKVKILVISSGELAKEVLISHDADFYYRPRCREADFLGFGSTNIAFSEGRHHWLLRKLCDTRLFSPATFASYSQIYRNEAKKMLHSVWEASKNGEDISVRDTVTIFVRNSLCRMLMGTTHLDIENISIQFTKETLISLMEETITVAGELTLSDLIPGFKWLDLHGRTHRMKDLYQRLEMYFQVIIDERCNQLEKSQEENKGSEPLVDVLLSLEGEEELSNEAIMGILLDTLIGGTSTTSTTVEWALAELVRHPAMLEKVQMEMTDVIGPYSNVEESDLPQLPYFQALVKETLRLHPAMPISLPHMNKKATPLANYEVPAETSVLIDYGAIGRDPATWQKPSRFDPSRFTDTEAASQIDTFKLLPFGYGRRGCPGANLGIVLVQLALACLVQGFEWEPRIGQTPHDIDVKESFGVVCFKTTPLILRATPRLSRDLYEI